VTARVLLSATELHGELSTLLHMVDRLAPTHAGNPERWHLEKSDLRHFVATLIERTGGKVPERVRNFCTPQRDLGAATVSANGRTIRIERR
jgi:hypothetical protein